MFLRSLGRTGFHLFLEDDPASPALDGLLKSWWHRWNPRHVCRHLRRLDRPQHYRRSNGLCRVPKMQRSYISAVGRFVLRCVPSKNSIAVTPAAVYQRIQPPPSFPNRKTQHDSTRGSGDVFPFRVLMTVARFDPSTSLGDRYSVARPHVIRSGVGDLKSTEERPPQCSLAGPVAVPSSRGAPPREETPVAKQVGEKKHKTTAAHTQTNEAEMEQRLNQIHVHPQLCALSL